MTQDRDLLFLIDTVSLIRLTRRQLQSELVQQHSTVLEEIAYEIRSDPKSNDVANLVERVDVDVLNSASELLKQPVVQKLLDLYNNKGNGDVLLLAKAVLEKERGTGELFPINWVIVTNDAGLVDAATANGVDTMDTTSFASML